MGRRGENDSPDSREAKVSELGATFATALLAGDEVAAEIAIRDAIDARLSSAEIDDASRVRARPGVEVCRRVSEAVEAVDALVKRAEMN